MSLHTLTRYRHCEAALRDQALKQALYDAGAVVMKDALITLHGDAHRARRQAEMRVFRRDFFKYYEHEVFPRTLEQTLAPALKAGRAELIAFGYQVTVNLTADFAGIDRPQKSAEETETLLALVKIFSEGATLVHSTRDKGAVEAEVKAALQEFSARFEQPSIARRATLLKRFHAGEIAEEDLPRDVLTMLLKNEDKLELPDDVLLREMAFYMQAGAHSTSNATVHALHEIFSWAGEDAKRWARLENDPLFVQRCVHESLRLHPASPEAWRRPICPAHIGDAKAVGERDQIALDLFEANRDREIFGADADKFNPDRALPKGVLP
ncbi:MAG: cytochrome P450, partial [Alphaproteobacteria bacterium]